MEERPLKLLGIEVTEQKKVIECEEVIASGGEDLQTCQGRVGQGRD